MVAATTVAAVLVAIVVVVVVVVVAMVVVMVDVVVVVAVVVAVVVIVVVVVVVVVRTRTQWSARCTVHGCSAAASRGRQCRYATAAAPLAGKRAMSMAQNAALMSMVQNEARPMPRSVPLTSGRR